MPERFFPVLISRGNRKMEGQVFPCRIPWEALTPFETQAINNHQQSLEVLAQRGGLSAYEMYAACHNANYHDIASVPPSDVAAFLRELAKPPEVARLRAALERIEEGASVEPNMIARFAHYQLAQIAREALREREGQ